MELVIEAITATLDTEGGPHDHIRSIGVVPASDAVMVGPVQVSLTLRADGLSWSVANRGDGPVRLRTVAVLLRLAGVVEPLRMFRHGYQSWSPSGVATLGVHDDPSVHANFPFVQGVYHADSRRARDGELRSEWCTVLADAGVGPGHQVVFGFEGGDQHDGTFRVRGREDGVIELRIEAFLGGAMLRPGEERKLHGVSFDLAEGTPSELLSRWAHRAGRSAGARVSAPFLVGWCSWYHFFDSVTEGDLRRNLAVADDWPFDVFQLDDGYQAAIGDWRDTNAKFPSGLDVLASDISAHGMKPGIWLAPFLAAPDSEVVRLHPEWIAHVQGESGLEPLRSWWNPAWGGGEDGFMYSLDTTNPDVLGHLEQLARDLVAAGFSYLKLDFTFAPTIDGLWADPARTPAERVRLGYDAIRRGAGEETFILGCGVPLANVVGVVDANRIGPDVAPLWALKPADEIVSGYLNVQPATRSAVSATVARSFMHRQLWLNDPDCIMLRSTVTELGPAAAEAWDRCVAVSGGLVMVSDDLESVGPDARARLDEVVAIGRVSDDEARQGVPPRSSDLMEDDVPGTLSSAHFHVVVDVDAATSTLRET